MGEQTGGCDRNAVELRPLVPSLYRSWSHSNGTTPLGMKFRVKHGTSKQRAVFAFATASPATTTTHDQTDAARLGSG
jgi:hypothetical protein